MPLCFAGKKWVETSSVHCVHDRKTAIWSELEHHHPVAAVQMSLDTQTVNESRVFIVKTKVGVQSRSVFWVVWRELGEKFGACKVSYGGEAIREVILLVRM